MHSVFLASKHHAVLFIGQFSCWKWLRKSYQAMIDPQISLMVMPLNRQNKWTQSHINSLTCWRNKLTCLILQSLTSISQSTRLLVYVILHSISKALRLVEIRDSSTLFVIQYCLIWNVNKNSKCIINALKTQGLLSKPKIFHCKTHKSWSGKTLLLPLLLNKLINIS